MAKPKKKTKKKELTSGDGSAIIALSLGQSVQASWKIVSEKLDVYDGGHLTKVLEAVMEHGRQRGRAEAFTEQAESLEKLFGKEIKAIERSTGQKFLNKSRKKPITIAR